MIQSDALSRQPDFSLGEDYNNVDIMLLPEALFIDLIDVKLQKKIVQTNNLDTNTAKVVKLLFKVPLNLRRDLEEWKTKTFKGNTVLFYKGKAYIPKD